MYYSSEVVYRAKSIISSVSGSQEHADKLFSIFIAMHAAQSLALPQQKSSDLRSFIVENKIDIEIGNLISPINEITVIDYAAVKRLAIQFYTFRHAMAFGGAESYAFLLAALSSGVGDIVATDAVQTLNAVKDNKEVSEAFGLAFTLLTKNPGGDDL